jgi:hypothetical protein
VQSTTHFLYRTVNTNKVKYKCFLHELGRSLISEAQNRSESSSDNLQLPQKQSMQRGPKQDPPGRLSDDFRIHKLEKNCWWWGGKKRSLLKECKLCAAHKKRSGTRNICKFCFVLNSQRVFFLEIPFTGTLQDYLHAVSEVSSSGA